MSTISLIASSLRSDLYGRYIIDRESPYTANEKDRLPTRVVCWAAAGCGTKDGSSSKLESRTRRLTMFIPPHQMSPPDCRALNWSQFSTATDVRDGSFATGRGTTGGRGHVRFAPKADKKQMSRDVRFVPVSTICGAAKSKSIRSPRRRGRAASGECLDVQCLGGLQVDDQLELDPPQDRKIGRLFRFQGCGQHAGPRPLSSTQAELQDEYLGYCGAMKAANSWALSGIGTVPRSASRASIVGSASTARISRSRRAMTAAGVPLGAPTPAQVLASYPGNASAIAGTSGSASKRRLPATASARSAPVRTCGSEVTITSKPICTWPASRSVIMGAPPR